MYSRLASFAYTSSIVVPSGNESAAKRPFLLMRRVAPSFSASCLASTGEVSYKTIELSSYSPFFFSSSKRASFCSFSSSCSRFIRHSVTTAPINVASARITTIIRVTLLDFLMAFLLQMCKYINNIRGIEFIAEFIYSIMNTRLHFDYINYITKKL